MLQQTQVWRVIPKYREFLRKYPTFEDLAAAPVKEVSRTWIPLGYNIRPIRLHSIARETVERYNGSLPDEPESLLRMKGIGRSTAGALLSFAFQQDAPIMDTNVMRLLHRVFIGRGTAKTHHRRLWALAATLIPKGRGYDFNQALMDFGALVCTARKPCCPICPMRGFCITYPYTPS